MRPTPHSRAIPFALSVASNPQAASAPAAVVMAATGAVNS
jgi:hypothetical protein